MIQERDISKQTTSPRYAIITVDPERPEAGENMEKAFLNIDSMKPNLLLSSRGVGAHSKYILHLLVAHEQDVTRNVPPYSLAAGRAGE